MQPQHARGGGEQVSVLLEEKIGHCVQPKLKFCVHVLFSPLKNIIYKVEYGVIMTILFKYSALVMTYTFKYLAAKRVQSHLKRECENEIPRVTLVQPRPARITTHHETLMPLLTGPMKRCAAHVVQRVDGRPLPHQLLQHLQVAALGSDVERCKDKHGR